VRIVVRDPRGSRQAGLGLGLSIVRHLVELHGGSVDARSAGENQGSEFVVTIPWWNPKDVRPRSAGEDDVPREADLESLRVLLVEDDADNRDLLSTMLRSFQDRGARRARLPATTAPFARAGALDTGRRPLRLGSPLARPAIPGQGCSVFGGGGSSCTVQESCSRRATSRKTSKSTGFWT
jgi:hypothetical protein